MIVNGEQAFWPLPRHYDNGNDNEYGGWNGIGGMKQSLTYNIFEPQKPHHTSYKKMAQSLFPWDPKFKSDNFPVAYSMNLCFFFFYNFF